MLIGIVLEPVLFFLFFFFFCVIKPFINKRNLLSGILQNVLKIFVPNKFITCDDSDPSWINNSTKNAMYKLMRKKEVKK